MAPSCEQSRNHESLLLAHPIGGHCARASRSAKLKLVNSQQLKLYFKLVNKNLPEYFNAMPIVHNSDIHTYHTRNNNNIYINRVNHNFATNCIIHSIIHTVNNVPFEI